jgi:methylated-DNA-[protein]-cysteine S-methyltransferase
MTTDMSALERQLRESARGAAGARLPDIAAPAAAAGLLDVAYATTDSPVGKLLLAATDRGLVRLAYLQGDDADPVLRELAAAVSRRMLAAPRRLDQPRRELDQYFAGARRQFDVPLDWRLTHGFGRRVLRATARIPFGSASNYKEIAAAAGSPRGFRAAGNALGHNPIPIIVPCHRVLGSGGSEGGFSGGQGLPTKRTLLALEGVVLL